MDTGLSRGVTSDVAQQLNLVDGRVGADEGVEDVRHVRRIRGGGEDGSKEEAGIGSSFVPHIAQLRGGGVERPAQSLEQLCGGESDAAHGAELAQDLRGSAETHTSGRARAEMNEGVGCRSKPAASLRPRLSPQKLVQAAASWRCLRRRHGIPLGAPPTGELLPAPTR